MLCQRCKKQQATIHLTEILHNEKRERHLCEDCAREEGVAVKAQINLQDILSGMLEAHQTAGKEANLTCPDCGITYAEFRNQGRLGCPHDYEVFAEPLREVLQKVHGATEHLGKVPQRAGADTQAQRELLHLRRQLQEAVESEKYEEAARLRDLIQEKEAAGETQ
ncbi:MAG TPA: UvrB/UvrC motif-containing protein [Phycisphaerae bacterium]|nr:UvrB/UvrC motif-containing protein [Phycisphaerae bacterium]